MECELCNKSNVAADVVISQNDSAICYMCFWPLKKEHMIIIPKRHVEKLTDLSDKESYDLLSLCEKMQDLAKKSCKKEEEPFLFKNYGKGITQPHLHFHIVPSKGALRHLVTAFEPEIPFREKKTDEEMIKLAQNLIDLKD